LRLSRVSLLIVGFGGYAGTAISRRSSSIGLGAVVGLSRRTGFDITDRSAAFAAFESMRPAAVINVAAVLGNSGGPAAASWPVNVTGAGIVAAAAASVGARLVHVSSDVVHGGRPEPYTEADDPTPVFPYGAAKAAAEAAVSAAHPAAVVVRTSLIVSGSDGPPSRHELREMVVQPAARTGVTVEPDLVACVLTEAAQQPGALPWAAHVLRETWQARRGASLRLADYEAVGGLRRAVATGP